MRQCKVDNMCELRRAFNRMQLNFQLISDLYTRPQIKLPKTSINRTHALFIIVDDSAPGEALASSVYWYWFWVT